MARVMTRLGGRRTVGDGITLLLALGVVTGACSGPSLPSPRSSGAPTASTTPSSSLTSGPQLTPSPSPTGQAPCAQRAIGAMSMPQRIGQLFSIGLGDNRLGPAELTAIRVEHVGSVWFTAQTSIGVAGIRAIADAVQKEATAAATDGVAFFVAANQEGGLIQALQGPGFSTIPSAVVQGQRPPATLMADARRWGQQLRAAGVNLDFAPVADVVPPGTDATNQPIGVLQREYGHDPTTAGSHAAAFVAGLREAGVATTAKHFPGLGRVADNTDFSAGVVDDVTTARDPYLASFRAAIADGVPFVMVALATYTRIDPTHVAAFSPRIIGGLLRGDLGFQGVVMSDALTAAAVAAVPPGQRAVDFLRAGGDLIVSSAQATAAMVAALQARAAADASFAARLDDAALHVLMAKQSAGLLACSG
jgi:beta-N-acetylhexosaminidase